MGQGHGTLRTPMKELEHALEGKSFRRRHIMLLLEYILFPSSIPGDGLLSKLFATIIIPPMVVSMMVLGFMVKIGCYLPMSELAQKINSYQPTVMNDLLTPEGLDEARAKICSQKGNARAEFNYLVAFLLLVLSGNAYEQFETSQRFADQGITSPLHLGDLKTKGGPAAQLFLQDKAIILVFKGTSITSYDECLIDATLCRDNHRGSYNELLGGQVHKGFYDTLLRSLNTATASYGNIMNGPPNPLKIIMEEVFIRALEKRKAQMLKSGGAPESINVWITGHSLGGALAALAMARLQTIVKEGDPLLVGWDSDGQAGAGVGRTVFEVMLAQFHKAYPSYSACLNCTICDHTKWRSCKDCQECKKFKMESKQQSTEDCARCKQQRKDMKDKAGDGYLWGCQTCKEGGQRCECGLKRCENCYQYCGECGNCSYCDIGKNCKECKKLREPSLVVLRDCYTFGCPRIGDTVFAKAVAKNQSVIHADPHYRHKSTHWRVATENDIVTKLPLGDYDSCNNPKPQVPGRRSSLMDYRHIGYLVRLHNAIRQPDVRKSSFEAESVDGVLVSKEVLQGRRAYPDLGSPSSQKEYQFNKDLLAKTLESLEPSKSSFKLWLWTKQQLRTAKEICLDCSVWALWSHGIPQYCRNLSQARFYFESYPGLLDTEP
ncbi:unnamed protein product [Mortierella alpina]